MEAMRVAPKEPPASTAAQPPTPLDASSLTPALMQSLQLAWLDRKLPSSGACACLARLLACNATPDELPIPASFPDMLRHDSLRQYWKFLKFLVVTYVGMWLSREFAKKYGSTWNEDLDMEEFVDHHFWDTLSDVTLIYIVGRLHYRRGVDCANFLLPFFFGACVWELIGKNPQLSKNLSCISECWTPLTYVVFLSFMALVLAVLGLHLYKMWKDSLLPGRLFEMLLIFGLTLAPVAGNESFHLHHWTWAWLGALVFNLRFSWSFGAQGFMVGMYANGIGIWGRDPVVY
ncbi:hypothetical protein TeGR_g5531 [Tetraparma gracilis]|uniref:Uncharacterized protein n=1 Tax=Tetraparma gracilis TaxID=2962635 RepID=A0ABQ6ME43_9STRA|nr:hypothetical protein TeGR_g5531 [Tetraparma gracilis]